MVPTWVALLIVFGGNPLRPATVEAPYIIRVVLALLLAAIQINGQSRIKHADPIRRAYPHFVEKLTAFYRHGMLELTLPLKDSVKPRRVQIEGVTDTPKRLTSAA